MPIICRQHVKFFIEPFFILLFFFFSLSILSAAEQKLPAFPGAEGFGSYTVGGRGGKNLFVTNLEDYVPGKDKAITGSLRAAINEKGSRTIIFRVSGIVPLKAPLVIKEPFITIAGQTAPGDGICIKNYGVYIKDTHDVIIRYVRFRPGDEVGKRLAKEGKKWDTDALSGTYCSNVIIDHCSASWANDEVLSLTYATDITVQWCFITESLNHSTHSKGRHGYGTLIAYIGDGRMTIHHNLYAFHYSRSPRLGTGTDNEAPGLLMDFRNNVIFKGGKGYSVEGIDKIRLNYVSNYIQSSIPFASTSGVNLYLNGNLRNGKDSGWKMIAGEYVKKAEPFDVPAVKTDPAQEAFEHVMSSAGGILPVRDAIDKRIAQNVKENKGDLIDSQDEVGGWSELKSSSAPKDIDSDGMPDSWEKKYSLNPDKADNNDDSDGDGYTNLEEYLNNTDPNKSDFQR